MAGLETVVVFWTGWGIHFTVVVSFTVQVTLLLLGDIRRRRDWAWLKAVIWSAYMLADTAAIYALGHMSVVCRSPQHQLMALWAPLLLVHLGGQDNITAYAIEDNRLWLRHLQTLVLQVAAAVYVLYASSVLSHPVSWKLSLAAMLMFVVGVLKYGERIWALNRSNSCASSSLSATSYDKQVSVSRSSTASDQWSYSASEMNWGGNKRMLSLAYSLLDVPKQMFEGPTSYVQISNTVDNNTYLPHEADMLDLLDLQLWMMYDLLYTKAAVVHTRYGLCSRALISLPFTIAALALFRSSLSHDKDAYTRADVAITNVLLVGAVVLEIMSVLRAIFSKWTAIQLYGKRWNTIGDMVRRVEDVVTQVMEALLGSASVWSGDMRQHSLFELACHSGISRGSKVAKRIGVEDWWDSNAYSWSRSTRVPHTLTTMVLELVSSTTIEEITKSWGQNALRRSLNNNQVLVTWIWTEEELKLEERILVWHIATHVYKEWCRPAADKSYMWRLQRAKLAATEALTNYMFFLLAARPYMLPYPVSRQAYVQLCSDAVTRFRSYCCNEERLLSAILNQKEALIEGTPLQLQLQPDEDQGIDGRQGNGEGGGETGAAAGTETQPSMNNSILDRGCQLAAKLIHITANKDMVITEQAQTFSVDSPVILIMLLRVWTEMLCYTAYWCNENYHAKHLTDGGGEIMTSISLLMVYVKNGIIGANPSTSGTAAGSPSSQQARATDKDTDDVV